MSSKLVVQVEPERLELRLRGVSALAAGTVYAPVVLEGAGGAVAPVLRLFRDETCADAAAWTSEPASPVPHHARLSSFPSLRLDTEAMLGWFSDVRDAKSLPSSGRVWGWLVAVDMGNGSDVGPAVLGASRVPVLLHDFSPVETDPGESWSDVLAGLVSAAVRDIAQSDWAETDPSAGGYVRNKPELGALATKSEVAEADLASALSSKISGKAEKSEMSVVAGTGSSAGTATITLKTGTSATVLTQHQSIPAQTQADWNETDTQSAAYIRNKPTIDATPTASSTNPVQSGGVKTAIDAVAGDVDDIKDLIPDTASSSNQLADTAFVNSSIATNTANYISNHGEPFESVTALNAYSGTKTNNDYAFVVGEDSAGNKTYTRYKWTGSAWATEYVLNNSSFTSEQWAAITSGITSSAVTKLSGIEAGAEVNVIETVKVNGTALTPSGKAVDIPIPATTATLAQERYDPADNSVMVDVPSKLELKLKFRNISSNTVNTLDTSTGGTIATREWVQQEIDVPSPSDADPAANGTAWEGESDDYSRADHVHPTDTSRQASITASGILKGNGAGGVTAAVAGTDYQSPLSAYTSTPSAPTESGSAGSSTAYARGDHVHPAETLVVTATLNLANMTVGNLSHTFSEILAARQAGREVLLEANAMTGADEGGRLLAWCSAEFGSVSGQSLQIGQLWFSAFVYTNVFDGYVDHHVYYGAVDLEYDGTATLDLTHLADQGDLAGKLSTTGDTRTVTATDSGGTEIYKFAGTGDTDANTVVRVKNLPYINEGEAEEMLVDVYAISSRGVQRHTATSGETSATFGFADTPGTGKIADALLDIDNSGNTSALGMEFSGLGTTFTLVAPDGEDLAEMTSVDGGAMARFYFTETALVSNNLPVISIQRITLGAVATSITRGS